MIKQDTHGFELNLRLFDVSGGGGAAAPGAQTPGAEAPGAEAPGAEAPGTEKPGASQKTPETKKAGKGEKNSLSNVKYGKQPAKAESETTEPVKLQETETGNPPDRDAEFEQMIKGDFKDAFTKKFQAEFNQRFKEHKQNEVQLKALQPILDALGSKLGVDPNDVEKLAKAVQADDSYFEDEAAEKGVTVESLKYTKQLERENAEKTAALEEAEKKREADRYFQLWMQETDACKKVYPGFDFRKEVAEPGTGAEFMRLLKAHIPMKTAFEVVHKDQLLSGAIGYARADEQKKTMDTIKARGMRADENGSSGNAAAMVLKSDPSKFSKADRREILRRAGRGERIEL